LPISGQLEIPRAEPVQQQATDLRHTRNGSVGGTSQPSTTGLVDAVAVARRLGMSKAWVTAAARRGLLPHYRLPSSGAVSRAPLRFDPVEIDAWLERARAAWRPGDSTPSTLARVWVQP
jgi:predicted DNA-binding transcriptional regulator AlpA